MSTADLFMSPDPTYGFIGPGMNAANMDGRGWLDPSRVWTGTAETFSTVIQLRPLHRRDLPGVLVARLDEYFVEFRVTESWDANIPSAVVLIHRYDTWEDISYLMSGTEGQQGLGTGDVFEYGDPNDALRGGGRVEVVSIDEASLTATLRLLKRSRLRPPVEGPLSQLGGIARDGGGLVVIGGHAFHVPPRSPVTAFLEHVSALSASETISDPTARLMLQQHAYEALASEANMHLERLRGYGGTPPEVDQERRE